MHPKFEEVLNGVSKEVIPEYEELEENLIYFQIPGFNYHFNISAGIKDDILKMILRCNFGVLDTGKISANSLFDLLVSNGNSFKGSSAYLSLTMYKDRPHIELETYKTFLMRWPSLEIAYQVELAFANIIKRVKSADFPEIIIRFPPG